MAHSGAQKITRPELALMETDEGLQAVSPTEKHGRLLKNKHDPQNHAKQHEMDDLIRVISRHLVDVRLQFPFRGAAEEVGSPSLLLP
jgi:hypothetical protein